MMNYKSIMMHLDDVADSVESLKSKLREETDEGLKQELEEIIWHIVAAWNMRYMEIEEASNLPDDDFKSLGQIPEHGPVVLR